MGNFLLFLWFCEKYMLPILTNAWDCKSWLWSPLSLVILFFHGTWIFPFYQHSLKSWNMILVLPFLVHAVWCIAKKGTHCVLSDGTLTYHTRKLVTYNPENCITKRFQTRFIFVLTMLSRVSVYRWYVRHIVSCWGGFVIQFVTVTGGVLFHLTPTACASELSTEAAIFTDAAVACVKAKRLLHILYILFVFTIHVQWWACICIASMRSSLNAIPLLIW